MARKIVAFLATSVDGFIATRNGGVEWCFHDDDYGLTPFLSTIDAVVLGRRTYDVLRRHGMTAYPGVKNYVFSRRLRRSAVEGVELVRGRAADFARSLRRRRGKHVWLVGGADLIRSFLAAGEVDEFILAVHPVALGSGIPLFKKPPGPVRLKPLRCRPHPTGLVLLRYAVLREGRDRLAPRRRGA
jgi:dihydrofolate reductase